MADLERVCVSLKARDGSTREGIFEFDHDDEQCVLTLEMGPERVQAQESDFFEALAKIREVLERRGLVPVCYGASRNVFPSGMARDMGAGLKAYKLTLGQQAFTKDLVGIFDTGPDIDAVFVEEQERFYNGWLNSLRSSGC